jgi:MGT family glycosyltransferase
MLGVSRHVAFFSFPAYAHIAPTLPLVAELVGRGHRVTYVVADKFAGRVAATGADVLTYDSEFPWSTGLGDPGDADHAARAALCFMAEGLAPLRAAARRFADDLPDLFVHDLASSEAARLLARKWDRPIAQTCPTFASNESFRMNDEQARFAPARPPVDLADSAPLAEFAESAHRLLDDLGLTGVDIDGFGADFGYNIVFLPREFQIGGETFDERYAFIGPCFDSEPPATDWKPPADGLPLVLISLGTSHSGQQIEFFRRCVRAFSGRGVHVMLTLGDWVKPAELGPVGENVEVHRFVPHLAVLPHVSAFVTHGGMGSLMEALHWGVPMVAVPHHVDQQVIAGQVGALGLGQVLSRSLATEGDLRDAVAHVAGDPLIKERVAAMRRHVRGAGGAARGADMIEAWADARAAGSALLAPETPLYSPERAC